MNHVRTSSMTDEPTPPQDPRVRFAAERTLMAWMRTGLALMGFGFVVSLGSSSKRLPQPGRVPSIQDRRDGLIRAK